MYMTKRAFLTKIRQTNAVCQSIRSEAYKDLHELWNQDKGKTYHGLQQELIKDFMAQRKNKTAYKK